MDKGIISNARKENKVGLKNKKVRNTTERMEMEISNILSNSGVVYGVSRNLLVNNVAHRITENNIIPEA
jgi:hypothetical protein